MRSPIATETRLANFGRGSPRGIVPIGLSVPSGAAWIFTVLPHRFGREGQTARSDLNPSYAQPSDHPPIASGSITWDTGQFRDWIRRGRGGQQLFLPDPKATTGHHDSVRSMENAGAGVDLVSMGDAPRTRALNHGRERNCSR
jgi:hypothetical protein